MPKPVDFPGTNLHLTAPKGQEHRVQDINAFNNGMVTVLCLEFTTDEIHDLSLNNGKVFLSIWGGASIPPFYVGNKDDTRAVVADYGALWKDNGS